MSLTTIRSIWFWVMIVEFIGGFPNGLSPALGACGALISATLDSAKKTFENEDKT